MRFYKGQIPWNKGKSMSPEQKEKLKLSHLGYVMPKDQRQKISISMMGKKNRIGIKQPESFKELKRKQMLGNEYRVGLKNIVSETTRKKLSLLRIGEKNPMWNPNREAVKRNGRGNNNVDYISWARSVKRRDGYACKLKDENCKGRLESHHIKPWAKFLETRYDVNNGITLCQFHHPRKRDDELRLIPTFLPLVGSN